MDGKNSTELEFSHTLLLTTASFSEVPLVAGTGSLTSVEAMSVCVGRSDAGGKSPEDILFTKTAAEVRRSE